MQLVTWARSGDSQVCELLKGHPRVERVEPSSCRGIQFAIGPWEREVSVGDARSNTYGLIEIVDNNPIVCADSFSVPSPAVTLTLIALAPLAQASLIADTPATLCNHTFDDEELESALATVGWSGGIASHFEPFDAEGVVAATVMVAIKTPSDLSEIDDLFSERYDKSFFVQREETLEWGPQLVLGKPHAAFQMQISEDQPYSLLTIRLLADLNGKCGAGQIVHAMNIMCGFEESLGIV